MFKVVMLYPDGTTEEEEIFETESEAHDYGLVQCSNYLAGGEVLNLSNPSDYPLDDDAEVDFEFLEVST